MVAITPSEPPLSQNAHEGAYQPGASVGRFRLLSRIASGGMAHVWAAEPVAAGSVSRILALKVIRPELAGDDEYTKLFVDEAAIATAVQHPNVCETYELGRHAGTLFMAMEWVQGDSLAGLLKGPEGAYGLPLPIAVRICAEAAEGLHAAHEAVDRRGTHLGVIHRDVSPQNILLSLQGHVKVTDFGIAKARQQLHERTRTGEVKGKFAYLAPEQIGGAKVDRRADIYSLGCVLYTVTLGLRPFGHGPEAMLKIATGEFKHPLVVDPLYPPDLERIILRCMDLDPAKRYQTAHDVHEALEGWLWESRHLVTQAELAAFVESRISAEAKRKIAKLRMRHHSHVEEAYQRLEESFELLDPPTASTGMIVPKVVRDRAQQSSGIPELKVGSDAPTVVVQVVPSMTPGNTRTGIQKAPSIPAAHNLGGEGRSDEPESRRGPGPAKALLVAALVLFGVGVLGVAFF